MAFDDDAPAPYWRQRPKPIGFEIAYRLKGDVLEVDSTRKIDRVRLSSVRQVRFFYAPNNISTKGFKTKLTLADGKTLTFGNLSWRSFTDLERDDPRYHDFVEALAGAIARANPACRFIGGRPPLHWGVTCAVTAALFVMMVFVCVRALQQGSWPIAVLGLLLGAASWWQIGPMVRLNKPRDLATGEVPPDLVPGGTAS